MVLVPGEVVSTILVPPVDRVRDVLLGDNIPAVGRVLHFTIGESGLADAASLPSGKESLCSEGSGLRVVLRLRERVDCFIVVRIFLLFFGGLVPHLVGPSVLGSAPSTARLNQDVVDTFADSEEALFTPV